MSKIFQANIQRFFTVAKQKFPITITSILFILTIYFLLRVWVKSLFLVISEIVNKELIFLKWLFGSELRISIITFLVFSILGIFGWLLSTRVFFFQKPKMRIFYFLSVLLSIWGGLALLGMGYIREHVIPFFQKQLKNVIETDGFFESIVFKHTDAFYMMLILLPVFLMVFVTIFLLQKYTQFEDELKEAFFDFQWTGKWLQKFEQMQKSDYWPDIELGSNKDTKEMVVLPGRDRTLNTMMIGSIGTGKTSALGIPILNGDLHHMTKFINDFPKLYGRKDFLTELVGGRYLNGISIIDPSNDLCQKVLKLAKAHGIPDEAITYINPLDPKTPSINPMRGPVDKVAEIFSQVIAGLNDSKDGGSFFFEQAQRTHLKHFIYLLKLHEPDKDVTFDMLIDMYNNPRLVHEMHVKLKERIPDNIDSIEDRDTRNYWKIVKGVDDWFDSTIVPKLAKNGLPELDELQRPIFIDTKTEHVQGLRNILNDISNNPLFRRVMFGHSDFDFDRHMAIGGILLVNTAKGDMVKLSNVLGKIILMNLQNATFRRTPNVSPFHHILVDEAPDYLYHTFREFPAQSRKYKVIVSILQQTIAQLADHFGEHYMTTLIGTMRNRMVYGDIPAYDAKYFSEMFGEKWAYKESAQEQSISPMQESPVTRAGATFQKTKEKAFSSGDLMYQDAFECSVKIVKNNRPMPVVQIKANFVPKEEFEVAKVVVNKKAARIWIDERKKYSSNDDFGIPLVYSGTAAVNENENILSIEETEKIYEEFYEAEKISANALNNDELKEIVKELKPRPRNPLTFMEVPPATPIERVKGEDNNTSSKENLTVPTENGDEEDEIIQFSGLSEANEEEQKEENNLYQPTNITKKEQQFGEDFRKSLFEEID